MKKNNDFSWSEIAHTFRVKDPYRWFWLRFWLWQELRPVVLTVLFVMVISFVAWQVGYAFGRGFVHASHTVVLIVKPAESSHS